MEEPPDVTAGLETKAAEASEIQAQETAEQTAGTEPASNDNDQRGVKRSAVEMDDASDIPITTGDESNLSKNQLRKLKRRKNLEEQKITRRVVRKEKRHEKQERKRVERETEIAKAAAEGREPILPSKKVTKQKPCQVPVSVIVDCQYEQYMMEKELVSLSSQITRCYSDNKTAQFPVHLSVSSFGGQLQSRFENDLQNQFKNWKGIRFLGGDFIDAAREAQGIMTGPHGGKMTELLEKNSAQDGDFLSMAEVEETKKRRKPQPEPEPEADDVDKSIVYLTADSPYNLERIEPNTSYVIGGIIDRNREKGLCYKVAREKKVRTAKLPIGEFMVLQSRHVLATNHVVEIMLRYLELGDWGAAFMKVIPTRKGGTLKEEDAADEAKDVNEAEPTEIEGNNEKEGLVENALGEKRWSAPPADSESEEKTNTGTTEQATAGAESNGTDSMDVEVEGLNDKEGLRANALDRERWSNPPVDQESA